MNCSRMRLFALLACAALLVGSVAWGQTGTASLSGEVTDPQGAAVVGAKVTLTNVNTKASREGTTDNEGRYRFVGLPPGRYTLRIEVANFRTAVRENLDLLVNTVSSLNVGLEVGQVTETMVIEASAAPLNTSDASLGNVITPTQVSSLPLEARNPVALLTLQAGVVFSGDPTDSRSGSVLGGRSDQANVTLDGVDVNDQQSQAALTTALPIPLDSIQEFRFTTSNPGADQGRSSGGQVAFVTKSGSNDFHGSAYWTHRNTATTANDFFNNRTDSDPATPGHQPLPVPKLLRNQYGGSLGGPILKDRAFFFGTYEGNRRREEDNVLRIGPTASFRDGVVIYPCADPDGNGPQTPTTVCPGGNVAGLTGAHAVRPGDRGLRPADIAAIDPLGIGVNPAIISYLGQFPACNDFAQGLGNFGAAPGRNFCGIRFNSPIALNSNVYVAKFDFNVTQDARHMVSWRGTLNDSAEDLTAAQFAGQDPQRVRLDNSKGFSTRYTAQVSSALTSIFTYGFTRQGLEFSGQRGNQFFIRSMDVLFPSQRAVIRQLPVHNITEDATWVHGSHTWQFGINFRFIRNDRASFANSFELVGVNDGICVSLCNELVTRLTGAGFQATDDVNTYKRAIMGSLGMITQLGTAAFFDGTQNVLASGQGVERSYIAREYEWYVQDSWRATRNLTIILGLRRNLYGVPYEANGFQTQPTILIQDFVRMRTEAMRDGRPSATIPLLSWELGGPANGKRSFYPTDKNNFAPNVSFAWTPSFSEGLLARIFGQPGKSVWRGGFRVLNDRVGGAFVVSAELDGAVGLVSTLSNRTGRLQPGGPPCTIPPSVRCAAPRFTGLGSLPSAGNFVTVPVAGFPATPPQTIANRGFVVDNRLRTPYAYAVNLTFGRELPGDTSLEIGYVGRFGHKLLAKADIAAPLIYLKDRISGQTFAEAANSLYLQAGTLPFDDSTPASLAASLARQAALRPIPHFENLFSGIADFCTFISNCTATQVIYEFFSPAWPSFTDQLIGMEGLADIAFPTYFQQQFDSLPAWTNLGKSNFHALQVVARKRLSHGLSFDFNYTYAKSMDNGSAVENSARLGGQIADIFNPDNFYSVSTFDVKHNMSVNWIYDLPVGRGRRLASDASGWANHIIGGWRTTGIFRYRTGFAISLENGFNFPTNFFLTGPGTQICPIMNNLTKNLSEGPNLFGNSSQVAAAFACADFTLSGSSGSRNSLRGPSFWNIDLGLRKEFGMPFEQHKLIFDWQVFNAFNHVNFEDRDFRLNPETSSTFGRFLSTIGPDSRGNNGRVMQFGLRYEF